MKRVVIFFSAIFLQLLVNAQKKSLTIADNDKWPKLSNWRLTPSGKIAIYNIGDTLFIQSIFDTSRIKYINVSDFQFIDDNYYSCLTANNNLIVGSFFNTKKSVLEGVQSCKLLHVNNQPYIAFLSNDSCFVLENILTEEKRIYSYVIEYFISPNEPEIVLKIKDKGADSSDLYTVLWLSLSKNETDTIVKNKSCDYSNYCFDKDFTKLALLASSGKGTQLENEIVCYYRKLKLLKPIVVSKTEGIDSILMVQWGQITFSSDGSQLFFYLQKRPTPKDEKLKKMKSSLGLDIWHYEDRFLQSQQLAGDDGIQKGGLMAVYNFNNNKAIQLQSDEDASMSSYISRHAPDGFRLVSTSCNEVESWWHAPPLLVLVSTQTGIKKQISAGRISEPRFSPFGKYVIYFDRDKGHYFTHCIKTGQTTNITKEMPHAVYDLHDDLPRKAFPIDMSAIVGWLEGDQGVLINDDYDLWLVDPEGRKKPFNVTNGYGRKHHIVLRYFQGNGLGRTYEPLIIKPDENLMFVGFNKENKYNGFFQKKMNDTREPEELFMGPYVFHYPFNSYTLQTNEPLKAKNANIFLVQRMSATDCLNLFYTTDFRSFKQLTNVAPQRAYNWYTSELIHWKMSDGRVSEGILYKPENFDYRKKYPVILTFYEKQSDNVNKFIYPESSRGDLNIPYYVSNGYIVFVPDIYYSIGKPSESVCNSIIPAVSYLSTKSWVDTTKIGLSGISFGAYEINVLITKTHLFAAAAESAGPVNFISGYGALGARGGSLQRLYEDGQNRIGKTLWQDKKAYIENSPIFYADKVNTPLLVMHNKADLAVPWSQGIEWFTALRRLDRKVWMLQYDGEGHGLSRPDAKIDYNIRQAQFFDHYLKGMPAPKWMTRGVHATDKGIVSGLELDSEIAPPLIGSKF